MNEGTKPHLSQVPLDDIEKAVAFYAEALTYGLPMGEVAHGLFMLQTTTEGSEALARALHLRFHVQG